jgi:hypothetical protein
MSRIVSPKQRATLAYVIMAFAPVLVSTPYFYLWNRGGPYSWENPFEGYVIHAIVAAVGVGSAGCLLLPIPKFTKFALLGGYFFVGLPIVWLYGLLWCPLCDF